MQETTVARSYAEALLELARTDAAVEEYGRLLGQVRDLLEAEPQFRLFLETPRIEPADKKRVLREVLSEHLPERLLRFLLIVIDKRRQRLLPAIVAEFHTLVDEHFGRLEIEVTVAEEADEALKAELRERLGRLLDREVIPRYRIDPRIVGGVIVRVEDRIMDGSVRHRLQQLKRNLLKTEVG